MGRVYYVECTSCRKEYYLDRILYDAVLSNPEQKLKCPFCKKEFYMEPPRERPSKK